MNYYLYIRHKGLTVKFERPSIEDAYQVAKLVSNLLSIRITKPRIKRWIRYTSRDCFFEYDITHKADRDFCTMIAIRSQLLPNEYWRCKRPYLEKKIR